MARSFTGTVVSDKANKTIVVRVDRRVPHPIYRKSRIVSTKLHAHDEKNEAGIGDLVKIQEVPPISKQKKFRLVSVVTKAQG